MITLVSSPKHHLHKDIQDSVLFFFLRLLPNLSDLHRMSINSSALFWTMFLFSTPKMIPIVKFGPILVHPGVNYLKIDSRPGVNTISDSGPLLGLDGVHYRYTTRQIVYDACITQGNNNQTF